jgi:thymidine kinase
MNYGMHPGWIEVISGVMFSGKSEELIRRVRRAIIARRRVQVFKSHLDSRYAGLFSVTSHDGTEVDASPVDSAAEIYRMVRAETEIVAIDEAQFFGPELVPVVGGLAGRGLVVIVAGLDVTFDAEPFEPLPSLMALAERVDKLTAICAICGEDAVFHVRVGVPTARPGDLVADHVGGTEKYQARCRRHIAGASGSAGDD